MEPIDIFDGSYNLIGTEERDIAHEKGLWHQTFHCWVIRTNGKMIIQQRGKDVRVNPNLLDVSAAGHLHAGEKMSDAMREIEEELGIKTTYGNLTHLGHYKDAYDFTPICLIRHFTQVYFMQDNTPLDQYRLQKEEVDGIYEIDIKKAIPFFYGDTDTISIEGYKRTDEGLEPHTRIVTFEDFTAVRTKWFWLKIFIMAERYMNGEKYLAV